MWKVKIDPFGLARFGFRPLAGLESEYEKPDGTSNHHIAHEQLWFDDNPDKNVGFFGQNVCGKDGDVRSDGNYNRSDYDFTGQVYDDDIMRQALNNIRNKWNDSTYCVTGNNCQHFADALREEYKKIVKPPTCRMTRRGMRCY